MKLISLFLLTFAVCRLAIAHDFAGLDRDQLRLQENFQATKEILVSEENLRELLGPGKENELKSAIGQIEAFFSDYDNFNLKKIDVFLAYVYDDFRERYLAARPLLKKKTQKKLDESVIKMEAHLANYEKLKIHFGKTLDYTRVGAAREFLNLVGESANLIRKGLKQDAPRTYGTKILPFIDTMGEFAPVFDDFIRLMWSAYFKYNKNKPNRAPIIESIIKVQKQIAKSRKTKTAWKHRELLQPMPLDGETLNVLVFMHANSYFDTAAQAELALPGLSSIGNVDVIMPPYLARQMVKSDHIVTVGHGDTMQKTEDMVREKRINKFFIAPEGLTPVGLYEMRPFVSDFADALYESIRRGLKLQVYPISFPDNFRLMNEWRDPVEGDRVSTGVVHSVLNNNDFIQLLKVTNDRQAAAHLIRWIWFLDLKDDASDAAGMPKPTQLKAWLDGMFWGNL